MTASQDDTELQTVLKNLGASENTIQSFLDNGYSNIDDLKSITNHELNSLIPQIFTRKKFALALVQWLLDNTAIEKQEIEENILLTAGIHPSQVKTLKSRETDCENSLKSCSSSSKSCSSYTNSTKSEQKNITSTINVDTDSANTESFNDIDLSLFERDIEEIDVCVRQAEDIANVENFDPNETNKKVAKPAENTVKVRQQNPIWLLLNKESVEGKRIANLPENTTLGASEIKVVAQIVAQYLFSEADPPKRQVPPSTCMFWSKNYFEALFPCTGGHRFYFIKNEKYTTKNSKEVNKGRPMGALHTQLSLLRKKLVQNDETAKLRAASSSTSAASTSKNLTPQKIRRASCYRSFATENTADYSPPEPDNETLKCQLDNLRSSVPTHVSAELIEEWTQTHEYRMRELKETKGTLWGYFKSYKGLTVSTIGPSLIRKDFQLLFNESDSTSKLQDVIISKRLDIIKLAKQVLNKLTAQVQKEKVAVFLALAEGHDHDITLQTTGLLLLLPFLFPGVYQVSRNWKPTKSNVLDSFVYLVDTEADVQEAIDECRYRLEQVQKKLKWEKSIHLQPFVIAIGPSWTEIEKAHIVLDKVIYTFPTVLESVEVCFQLFHSLHAEYPLECHNLWEFIQQAVYNIYTEFDWNHQTTSELAELLGLPVKRQAQSKPRTKKGSKK